MRPAIRTEPAARRARGVRRSAAPALLAAGLALSAAAAEQASEPAQAPPAQDPPFTLFESLDGLGGGAAARAAREARNVPAAPVFTLVGVARFGDRRAALLEHMGGDVVRVPLPAGGGPRPVPGHPRYVVTGHEAGEVSVRYPPDVQCGDFEERGVVCDADANVARLRLPAAAPVARAPAGADAAGGADGDAPRNPFELLREQQERRSGAGAPAAPPRFRRIDPADVPPGMRVVSTPFGDRLVEL